MSYQEMLFRWISEQPWITSAAILGLGFVYAFYGFRMFTFLLAITVAAFGWVAGFLLGHLAAFPVVIFSTGLALLGLLTVLKHERLAVLLACGASWSCIGFYLVTQFGSELIGALIASVIAGGLGMLFAWLCYRTMTVVLTTLQGAALIVIGCVGVSAAIAPTLNLTFRSWADNSIFVVPILVTMVCVTAYSFQAMQQRGNPATGAN